MEEMAFSNMHENIIATRFVVTYYFANIKFWTIVYNIYIYFQHIRKS